MNRSPLEESCTQSLESTSVKMSVSPFLSVTYFGSFSFTVTFWRSFTVKARAA